MIFRKAVMSDLDQMHDIAMSGVAFLKAQGIDQWQTGLYPNRAVFADDIHMGRGFVLEDNGEVIAVAAVIFGEDPSYGYIDGEWLNPDFSYVTIHRCAVAEQARGQGVMKMMFHHAALEGKKQGAFSLRVDTHPKNLAMQKAIAKGGFTKCGVIRLAEGAEKGAVRFSYERFI